MKKKRFFLFSLTIMFVLIGTANADWIVQTIATPPVMPEQLGLIAIGAVMVGLAVFCRTRLTRPSAK